MCNNTGLGILRSNTPFPHNVLYIVPFLRFSALLAFDLEDFGVICPEIFDLDPDKSRGCFDFIRALVAIALICIQVATSLFV